MSEIQLYKQPNLDISNFTPREIEIYKALQSPMLKDIQEVELYELFRNSINKSYLISIFNAPDPEQFMMVVDETMKMAKSKYGFVRANEVPLIMVRGCAKEFGDFMGLSFITFMGWFDGYIKDKKRIELTTPAKEEKIPSKEERFKIASKNALDSFLAFQIGKDISMQAPVVYRFLRHLELFKYSDEEQAEFMERARVMVLSELKNKKEITLDKFRRLDIEKMINGEMSIEEKVIAQAQRLGLYAYFQELQLNESDLQELINNAPDRRK